MKFLVFQHVPYEHPGLIADFAKKNNITLDVIELWKPYKIPAVSNYEALIFMGGPMGVYEDADKYPSKNDEVEIIKESIEKNIPVLGFCLGAQLLAYAFGAKVYPNIVNGKKIKEIGFYPINIVNKNPIFENFSSPVKVFQWHGDVFELPKEATLLASSSLCKNQAFAYKNAYGLLFHFEFTPEMIKKLAEIDKKWTHEDFDLDEKNLIEQANELQELMREQSKILLENFVSIIKSSNR